MAWAPPQNVGDIDQTIPAAKKYLRKFSYGKDLDDSGVYTALFGTVLKTFAGKRNDQIRSGVAPFASDPYVNVDGIYDWAMKIAVGVLPHRAAAAPTPVYRPIYYFSAPGSGANNLVGPASDVGNLISDGWGGQYPGLALWINHWRLNFPIGGYLGLMGGDPGLSYNEVITDEGNDLETQVQLAINEVQAKGLDPMIALELWFGAYSQSADGMKKAVARLFGTGGRYEAYRARINGLILFGDPTRQPGPVKGQSAGYNPPGYGIARYVAPIWLEALTYSITTNGDMYACTQDDTMLPGFYAWFVKAETSISFVEFSAGIIIPAIASYLNIAGPLIGGIFGSAGASIISLATGVGLPFLTQILGSGAVDDPEVVKLRNDLSASGLLTIGGITKLFKTLAALPGIQTHGEYFIPKPEFGGRTGVQVGYDIIAGFRR